MRRPFVLVAQDMKHASRSHNTRDANEVPTPTEQGTKTRRERQYRPKTNKVESEAPPAPVRMCWYTRSCWSDHIRSPRSPRGDGLHCGGAQPRAMVRAFISRVSSVATLRRTRNVEYPARASKLAIRHFDTALNSFPQGTHEKTAPPPSICSLKVYSKLLWCDQR